MGRDAIRDVVQTSDSCLYWRKQVRGADEPRFYKHCAGGIVEMGSQHEFDAASPRFTGKPVLRALSINGDTTYSEHSKSGFKSLDATDFAKKAKITTGEVDDDNQATIAHKDSTPNRDGKLDQQFKKRPSKVTSEPAGLCAVVIKSGDEKGERTFTIALNDTGSFQTAFETFTKAKALSTADGTTITYDGKPVGPWTITNNTIPGNIGQLTVTYDYSKLILTPLDKAGAQAHKAEIAKMLTDVRKAIVADEIGIPCDEDALELVMYTNIASKILPAIRAGEWLMRLNKSRAAASDNIRLQKMVAKLTTKFEELVK